jgi:glycosyltransferase involved in cell wall biosynthesis
MMATDVRPAAAPAPARRRPITVLDLRDTYEIGGPGKTILETYRAVDATRYRLHLAVFLRRDEKLESPFVTAALKLGMPVHGIRGYNQFDPRLIWRLAQLVRETGADIVHAHEVKSDVLTYLASFVHRVPIVTTLHGWLANSPKGRVFTKLDRVVARRFDKVIAVSERIRDDISGVGVRSKRVVLLHNAIVLDRYRRTGRTGMLTELIGRPPEGPVLASIGRLSPEKGHADLIEALGIVAARGQKVTTVLAGDGSERGALTERIRALGLADRVHLVGYIDPPQRILEETDLMVLPSHTEGLPNAALEALAMDVPVLATRVGGTPEVITDGVEGRLVEAHSPQLLADAILDFVANPGRWKEMAARGRAKVERSFDFRTRTQALEALYDELVMEFGR